MLISKKYSDNNSIYHKINILLQKLKNKYLISINDLKWYKLKIHQKILE